MAGVGRDLPAVAGRVELRSGREGADLAVRDDRRAGAGGAAGLGGV